MTARRLTPAAAVMAVGAVVLVGYVYRDEIARVLMVGVFARIVWGVGRAKLGIRRQPRRGRTVLEIVAAAVGAWWLSRRHMDVVKEAVARGAELSIQVRPPSQYPNPARYRR